MPELRSKRLDCVVSPGLHAVSTWPPFASAMEGLILDCARLLQTAAPQSSLGRGRRNQ